MNTGDVVLNLLHEMFAAEDAYGAGFYGEARWLNAYEALRTITEQGRLSGYSQSIKERAYKLDPDCWISYSGKSRPFKRAMDARRRSALERAVIS